MLGTFGIGWPAAIAASAAALFAVVPKFWPGSDQWVFTSVSFCPTVMAKPKSWLTGSVHWISQFGRQRGTRRSFGPSMS